MRGVVLACALSLAGCAGDDALEEPVDTGIVFEASTVEDAVPDTGSSDTEGEDTGTFDSTVTDASEDSPASDGGDAESDAPSDAPDSDAHSTDVALDVTLGG
jgi:hypothetical protein